MQPDSIFNRAINLARGISDIASTLDTYMDERSSMKTLVASNRNKLPPSDKLPEYSPA